jgi:hypothetical protein
MVFCIVSLSSRSISSTHLLFSGQYSSRGTGGRFLASNHSKTVFPSRPHHPNPSSSPTKSFALARHSFSDRCSKTGGQTMCGGRRSSANLRGSPSPQYRTNLHVPAPILLPVSRGPILLTSPATGGSNTGITTATMSSNHKTINVDMTFSSFRTSRSPLVRFLRAFPIASRNRASLKLQNRRMSIIYK